MGKTTQTQGRLKDDDTEGEGEEEVRNERDWN